MSHLTEAMETNLKKTKTSKDFQPKIWKEGCEWKGQREEELDIEIEGVD